MRKEGIPRRGELVISKIKRIDPHSASAELIEYKRQGIIQAPEVAKRWVRNIKEFLKEEQVVVCRVLDTRGSIIDLSVKRVHTDEAKRKLSAYKRELRFEKILTIMAKELGKTLDDAYDEIGVDLEENFGSLEKAFEIAWKNPDLLRKRTRNKLWADKVIETAQKSFTEKVHEVKSNLELVSYSSNGLHAIKSALEKAEKAGFDVRYISAPHYQILKKGKDFKKLRAEVEEISEQVVREINKSKGECSFEVEGKN